MRGLAECVNFSDDPIRDRVAFQQAGSCRAQVGDWDHPTSLTPATLTAMR